MKKISALLCKVVSNPLKSNMALSDSTKADRPNSAVYCMVCLSGFVKQCSLNVDSLMDFISACLLAEGSNLPPPGLAQLSVEAEDHPHLHQSFPGTASAALGHVQAASVLQHLQPIVGSAWHVLVVICPLAFPLFSLGRNGSRGSLHAQRCVGFLRGFFHITMQLNCMRWRGWLCYAETCLCLISYASESYSCVECLMILQVQFPLGNNVHDFVPVTAW